MKALDACLLLFNLICCLSCKDNYKEVLSLSDQWGNILEVEVLKGTEIKNGHFIKRNLSGAMIERSIYKNDTLEGVRVLWDDKGDTIVVEHYSNGKFEGLFRSFYSGNKINVESSYKNNQLEGWVTRYYPSGGIMEKVFFVNNEENGDFEEYYENGNIKATGKYKDGPFEEGELILYDDLAEKIRVMFCELGKCKTIWSRE
jgi:antitoxin component YwqK of YwqJK toxin-antitoxin module